MRVGNRTLLETRFGSRFLRMTKVSYFFKIGLHRPQNILLKARPKKPQFLINYV